VSNILEIPQEQPDAYSYVRFSIAKQELGDSLRRQVELAERYCLENNLKLHPVSFRDLGVSAFKRKNVEKGALAAFIDAVKTGKIAKGSYLVIEQFDRLSRADIDVALRLLLDLVHSGIVLITLVDQKRWDRESVKDIGNLILAIALMSRANNESAMKADRLSHVWGQKKKAAAETGKILTRECPRWLKVNDDKTAFIVKEDCLDSIRKVFNMRINGHGVVSIVRRANEEGWPVPGTGATWHTSLVGRLLHNRSLLGEYQPYKYGADDNVRIPAGEPILNYYPTVLDEQTFLRAQAAGDRKGQFPGRRDISYRNWLQGLLKCSCGQSFVRKNKQSSKQPNYARYYCTARNRGLTDCPSLGASEIEGAVISAVSLVAPQFWNGTARLEELTGLADVQQVDLSAAKEKRDRFVEAIGSSKAPIASLMQRLTAAEEDVEAAEKALAVTRAEMSELSGDSNSVFANIVAAVKTVDSLDARAALREDLSRVLLKCVVDARAKVVDVYVRGESEPIHFPLGNKLELSEMTNTDMYPGDDTLRVHVPAERAPAIPGLTFTLQRPEDYDTLLASRPGEDVRPD
jgi:DNA invertase Pin-like site-specific DNA recombinase